MNSSPSNQALPPELTRKLEHLLGQAGIPAASVAICHGGNSGVWCPGVSADTAFDIGSCSKSFVAAAIGILVSQGRLGFEDRVTDHLPEMQLDSDWISAELRIRDLLSNRIGLRRQVPVESFMNPDITPLEVIKRLRHLDRLHPFRSGYVYFNPGFIAARLIVERISGLGYDEFLENELFAPLGMGSSASGSVRAARIAEHAQGHSTLSGRALPIEVDPYDNWQGAAGIHLSANDALNWMRFLLNAGKGTGSELLSPAIAQELFRPHTIIPAAECKLIHCPPNTALTAYCLGWWTTSFQGHRLVQHAGEMMGWRAHVALMPEHSIGVAVMLAATAPRHAAIAYTVLDELLGTGSTDWAEVADQMAAHTQAATDAALAAAFPVTGAPLTPAALIGCYRHPALGPVDILPAGDGLIMQMRDGRLWDAELSPLGGAVYAARLSNPAAADYLPAPFRVRFDTMDGQVTGLTDHNAHYRRIEDNDSAAQ